MNGYRKALGAALAGLILASAPAPAQDREPARLLVVTVANGYVHESIPTLAALIEELGAETGLFTVDRADTNEALQEKTSLRALESYDGVVFANTSRDVPVADREAFLSWVEAGGAVIGIHGASTLDGWPEFTSLLGGQFDHHGDQATVQVHVADAGHPATRGLASPFEIHEEMYLYKHFDRSRVHMLLYLDRHPNTSEPGYYPWAWTREQEKGRIFHTGAGHRIDIVESAWFKAHLLGGIQWALDRKLK